MSLTLDEAAARFFARRDATPEEAVVLSHGGPLEPVGIDGPYAVFGPAGDVIAIVDRARRQGARRGRLRPGLTRLRGDVDIIELTSPHGSARVSRKGAQVLAAELSGRPLLWLSPWAAKAAPEAAIRAGVPICFPWFGKHPDGLPAHGFARNLTWHVIAQDTDRVVLALDDDAQTRSLWPYRFHAEIAVHLDGTANDGAVNDGAVNIALTVTNTDAAPFRFTYALHTYFAVDDARECHVDGLDGRVRRESGRATVSQRGAVGFGDGLDAIFEDAPGPLVLRDGHRRVAVDAPEMTSAVIWNPGLNDLADVGDEWPRFVCVERGRIGGAAVTLAPGAVHTASMRLRPTA